MRLFHVVKASAKGQVVVPAEYRRAVGLKPGQKVGVYIADGNIVLHPIPEDVIAAFSGCLKGGPSLTAELVREHQEEIAREEREDRERARRLRRAGVGAHGIPSAKTRNLRWRG